jgi:hypothetical protein
MTLQRPRGKWLTQWERRLGSGLNRIKMRRVM